MRISDWSSDVCSSDLDGGPKGLHQHNTGDHRLRADERPSVAPRLSENERQEDQAESILCRRDKPADRIAVHHAADEQAQDHDDVRSEEHTSELQSLMRTSYAVFCLKKKMLKKHHKQQNIQQSNDNTQCQTYTT